MTYLFMKKIENYLKMKMSIPTQDFMHINKSKNIEFLGGVLVLLTRPSHEWSLVMRKPAFCIGENKDADQLRSNCAADQRLCFRYTDGTIHLLPKSEILSL